jgi:hypothetical protein
MATVNLGKIKPNWKGTWATSTAYVLDDIVRSGVDSYICILGHTSASSGAFATGSNWELLVQGSNVGLGSGGQVLKTNSGANALEWGSAGKLLQIKRSAATGTTGASRNTSGDNTFTGNMGNTHCSLSITPSSTTSMFVVLATAGAGIGGNDNCQAGIYRGTGASSVCLNYNTGNGYSADAGGMSMTASYIPGNTTAVTISLRAIGCWGGNTITLGSRRSTNATTPYGDITVMEIEP